MFANDLHFGEIGEEVAWLEMLKSPKTKQVMDVRKDLFFQQMDIDFLQENYNGGISKIEVKTDRMAHKTNNIAFETKSHSSTGCLLRSKADWIYYYLYESKEIVYINMERLRDYVMDNELREVSMGDNAKGYLINIDELQSKGIALRKGTKNGK